MEIGEKLQQDQQLQQDTVLQTIFAVKEQLKIQAHL